MATYEEWRDAMQKPVTAAWLRRCREVVGRCWCQPTTSGKEMDVTLAGEFAKVLAAETSQPWLGNATNAELDAEMKSRREMGCTDPGYYTARPESAEAGER